MNADVLDFNFDDSTKDDVFSKIEFSISTYFADYYRFIKNDYSEIVSFYSGNSDEIKFINFNNLNDLIIKSNQIEYLLRDRKNLFKTFKDWDIIDYFDYMRQKLLTISKIDKFLRSSKDSVRYNNRFDYNYVVRQKETLESISKKQLNRNDYDDFWVQIATKNDISELDYDLNGGKEITLFVDLNSESVKVESVIDNIQGERVLGKDIDRNLSFSNDDFSVLEYEETFEQSVNILLDLRRGTVPEFLDFGVSSFVGVNINSFGFSSLIRQMTEVFSSDDSILKFTVLGVSYSGEDGDISLDFNLESRLGIVIKEGKVKI